MNHTHLARLFVKERLKSNVTLDLPQEESHYVTHVMRLSLKDQIRCFNGIDGEWLCDISNITKKSVTISPLKVLREQTITHNNLSLILALPKNDTRSILEKVTALGIKEIIPVICERSIVKNSNKDKLLSYIIGAAEQSERLELPVLQTEIALVKLIENWNKEKTILFCDEQERETSFFKTLEPTKNYAILIGPEGGFTEKERTHLKTKDFIIPCHLGSQILKVEIAVLSASIGYNIVFSYFDNPPR